MLSVRVERLQSLLWSVVAVSFWSCGSTHLCPNTTNTTIESLTSDNTSGCALELARVCDQGGVTSCIDLAALYYRGEGGVTRDREMTSTLFECACEAGQHEGCHRWALMLIQQGDSQGGMITLDATCREGYYPSCFTMAEILDQATTLPLDMDRSAEYLTFGRETARDQCSQGHGEACYFLAQTYLGQLSNEYDPPTAVDLLAQSCTTGFPLGCVETGEAYEFGELIAPDYTRALEFYGHGCDFGCEDSCLFFEALMNLVVDGASPIEQLLPEETTEYTRRIARWCDVGDSLSCERLARSFLGGTSEVPRNPSMALHLFLTSCETGVLDTSCYQAALMLRDGNGVLQDTERSNELFLIALNGSLPSCLAGDAGSCVVPGLIYHYGYGVERNEDLANDYLTISCERGFDTTCDLIGIDPP